MGWFSRLFGGGKEEKEMEGNTHMAPSTAGAKTARDPVCGMEVEMSQAAATSVYQGQTYYFCAPGCKRAFEQNPAKYLGGAGQGKGGMHGH